MKNKLLLVCLIITTCFFLASCAKKEYFRVSKTNFTPDYAEFTLIDGRVFVATKADNPYYYQNILLDNRHPYKKAIDVYFKKNLMYFEGTGEIDMFSSKEDIHFKVILKTNN